MDRGPYGRSGRGLETIGKVRNRSGPWDGPGWVMDLLGGTGWVGDPPRGSGQVGGPSIGSGRVREPLMRSGTGWGTLEEVQDGSTDLGEV